MSTDGFLDRRAAGVLLHPTSLPGPGIGDFGAQAYRFIDWLVSAGQSYWQILPLVPVDEGGSPYNALSAMALNPLLISPELLVQSGLLDAYSGADAPLAVEGALDYPAVIAWKEGLLRKAHERFRNQGSSTRRERFSEFRRLNDSWLAEYALFRALREQQRDAPWTSWPEPLRRRDPEAIARSRADLAEVVELHAFQQYIAERQWRALRSYAHSRGVRIIGDIPIFIAHDSADVWAHPEYFCLDESGSPTLVSGVPPDYFSPTGQRWGNPLYRWDVLARQGYEWWVERFRRSLELVDIARVDHFRGFQAYWEVESRQTTAIAGRWVRGPGIELFREVERRLGRLPLIAEDLGIITPDVSELRDALGYPGMRVLQFAFDGDPRNPHLPSNFSRETVAYTGTHDNNTILGWWSAVGERERGLVRAVLGDGELDQWRFIAEIMSSRAQLAIVPLQDVLGLGAEARMNTPGEAARNWAWRLLKPVPAEAGARLKQIAVTTGRSSDSYDSPADQRPESG